MALWIAKSRVIDFYRSQGRRPQFLSDDFREKYAEALVERREAIPARREALEDCLEQLPDRSRKLIRLRYYDGLKMDQIAEAVRSSPASVRVTMHRIRDVLSDCVRRRMASEAAE